MPIDSTSSDSSHVEDILEVTQASSGTSTDSEMELETNLGQDDSRKFIRKVPLSLTQEHFWRVQKKLSEDPAIFHNTIGL